MRGRVITALRPHGLAPIWRPYVSRAPSTQSRLVSQIVKLRDGQTIRRQDVFFKRPSIFSWRRLFVICLYGLTVYNALKIIPRLAGFDIHIELDDEEDANGEEHTAPKRLEEGVELTEEDLEADEESLFIPMTWAEKLPRTFYKGSDPEWQEFIRVAKDPKKGQQIMQQLLASFELFVQKNPSLMNRLGSDVQRGKHWLDVTFPDGPPQEYIRSGLEFGDGYIAWSRQRITDQQQTKLARVLWPSALFGSAYDSAKVFSRMQLQSLAEWLGYSVSFDASFAKHAKEMEAVMARSGKQMSNASPQAESSVSPSTSPLVSATTASERASKTLWPLPAVYLPRSVESDGTSERDVKASIAVFVFLRSLVKNWQPKRLDAPRGSFFVHGLIEVKGKLGRMLFDVVGIYDPKQGRFTNVQAGIKQYKRAKQVPRGGN